MAVNDLITVGATPLVVQAYWAAGGSDWFADAHRAQALVAGWKRACDICGVAWGGGETPALAGIVADGRIDLAASCTGLVNPKSRLSLGERLGAGRRDRAAGVERHPRQRPEPGAQAGRTPAARLSDAGCRAGRRYGEALLAPTTLYSPVTEALHRAGITPHYCANITGHGWRKLLRHPAQPDLPHRPRARGARRCSRFIQQHAARTTTRPTAPSTWAPASRCSSRPRMPQRTRRDRRAVRHRRNGRRPRRGRPEATADRTAGHPLRRRRAAAALNGGGKTCAR